MCPKRINFIFGLDQNFCAKPFSYFHYLNILSCKLINKDYDIFVYYKHPPTSIFFEKAKKLAEFIQIEYVPPISVYYPDHIGDILRLELLKQYGGVYIDIDTICVSPFTPLLDNECVMGMEYGRHDYQTEKQFVGLCNAAIVSKQDSFFVNKLLHSYYTHYTNEWNYNSVVYPHKLSLEYPESITILTQDIFFKYSWDSDGHNALFNKSSSTSNCVSIHLWESKNYDILSNITDDWIVNNHNTVANLYKRYI